MTPGNGTWDTATPNWSTTTTGDATLSVWSGSSADTADFYANSSPTSTITVNGNQSVGNITFDGSGYTLTGGQLNLGGGTITANANAEIDSVIGGSAGLTKSGTAQLYLTANNAYNGGTTVSAGTLNAAISGALGSGPNVVLGDANTGANAATLLLSQPSDAVGKNLATSNFGTAQNLVVSAGTNDGGAVLWHNQSRRQRAADDYGPGHGPRRPGHLVGHHWKRHPLRLDRPDIEWGNGQAANHHDFSDSAEFYRGCPD